jgi:hypothetical protein
MKADKNPVRPEEIPAGTFHGGVVKCPKCQHWFAADSYKWRTHRC